MNSTNRGKFISVEGQDGAGKTTNLEFVRGLLEDNGISVLLTREPGGTRLGEELRTVMLRYHDLRISPMAELLLMFAARAQHLEEVIRPALERGTWVLCDRFTDATYAYQGGGRGLPVDYVENLEALVQGSLRPDLTLLLDVDHETIRSRCEEREPDNPDRFEAENDSFKRKVRQAYLDLARRNPDRIRVIDATLGLERVQNEIRKVVIRFVDS